MNRTECLLAFNRMPGVGARTMQHLTQRFPEPETLFTLSQPALEKAGVPAALAHRICTFDRGQIEADLRWQEHPHHHLLTLADATYPKMLREIHDPPPVLYAHGNMNLLHSRCLGIVGTRKPSFTGQETARAFSQRLAGAGITIVSGLALGIDGQAHQGALDATGATIAVLGTGVDRIYPQYHTGLAQKIIEKGLLLSEFPLKTPPKAGHFPRRNRIISGLSFAILVVEAALKSGSLVTARLAMEQNRDVLAIPGSIYNAQSRGCHWLVQQGAKLVTTCEDVLEELAPETEITGSTAISPLATSGGNLVKCVGFEITTMDSIMARCGLSLEQVACELAELELQGFIRSVPGGYMRCKHSPPY